jgi:hypothetical protein
MALGSAAALSAAKYSVWDISLVVVMTGLL